MITNFLTEQPQPDASFRMVAMSNGKQAPEGVVPECWMLELAQPLRPDSPEVTRARQLILEKGSPAMLEAFDASVKDGTHFFGKPVDR